MEEIKSFFIKCWNWIKKTSVAFWNWLKKTCSALWKLCKSNKLLDGIIAGVALIAITVAIVVPVSVSAAKRKNNNEPQGEVTPPGDGGGEAQTFTIVWKNGDEVLETDTNVTLGSIPVYNGEEPTKADDEDFTYTWSGWSPSVVQVSANATYVATFTQHDKGADKKHTIDDDGTLQTANRRYRTSNVTMRITKEGTANYFECKSLGDSLRTINFNEDYDAVNGSTYYVAWHNIYKDGKESVNADWVGYKKTNKWSRSETMEASDMFSSEYYLDKGHGLYFDYIYNISKLSDLVYMDDEQVYTKAITFKGAGGYLKLRYDDNYLVKASISTTEGSYTQTFKKNGTTQVSDWFGLNEFQQAEKISATQFETLLTNDVTSEKCLMRASYDYDGITKTGNYVERKQTTGTVEAELKSSTMHYLITDSLFSGYFYYQNAGQNVKMTSKTSAPYDDFHAASAGFELTKGLYNPYKQDVWGYYAQVVGDVFGNLSGNFLTDEFCSEDYGAIGKYTYYKGGVETDDNKVDVTVELTFVNVESVPDLSTITFYRSMKAGLAYKTDTIKISNIKFGDADFLEDSDFDL